MLFCFFSIEEKMVLLFQAYILNCFYPLRNYLCVLGLYEQWFILVEMKRSCVLWMCRSADFLINHLLFSLNDWSNRLFLYFSFLGSCYFTCYQDAAQKIVCLQLSRCWQSDLEMFKEQIIQVFFKCDFQGKVWMYEMIAKVIFKQKSCKQSHEQID